MVSKGQIVGIDWNRIVRLQKHVLAHMNSLTASPCLFFTLNWEFFHRARHHHYLGHGICQFVHLLSTSFAPSYLVFVDMSVTVQ